jgi:hypothetical protein
VSKETIDWDAVATDWLKDADSRGQTNSEQAQAAPLLVTDYLERIIGNEIAQIEGVSSYEVKLFDQADEKQPLL